MESSKDFSGSDVLELGTRKRKVEDDSLPIKELAEAATSTTTFSWAFQPVILAAYFGESHRNATFEALCVLLEKHGDWSLSTLKVYTLVDILALAYSHLPSPMKAKIELNLSQPHIDRELQNALLGDMVVNLESEWRSLEVCLREIISREAALRESLDVQVGQFQAACKDLRKRLIIRPPSFSSLQSQNFNKPKLNLTLEAILAGHDLEIDPVPSDGNCLFHALAKQLRRVGRYSGGARELRSFIVTWMRLNGSLVVDSPLSPGTAATLSSFRDCEDWEIYLDAMAVHGGKWGDNCVLTSTAIQFNVRIHVFNTTFEHNPLIIETPDNVVHRSSSVQFGSLPQLPVERFSIFLGHIGESHYVSTCPKIVPTPNFNAHSHTSNRLGYGQKASTHDQIFSNLGIRSTSESISRQTGLSADTQQPVIEGKRSSRDGFLSRGNIYAVNRAPKKSSWSSDRPPRHRTSRGERNSYLGMDYWPIYVLAVPFLVGVFTDIVSVWQ